MILPGVSKVLPWLKQDSTFGALRQMLNCKKQKTNKKNALLGKRWEVVGCSKFCLFLVNFAEAFKNYCIQADKTTEILFLSEKGKLFLKISLKSSASHLLL